MAITKLTNTQIQNVVNQAYKEFTGQENIVGGIDLSQFTDNGTADVTAVRSRFTGKLISVLAKNMFTDSSYATEYTDVFYEDEANFGAIVQSISVEVPEVKENSAWNDFETGVTKVGQYTVFLPVVDTKYYAKSTSWELPITITGEQWDTAFTSEGELNNFVSYIFMVLNNAILLHRENMNQENRNNFIAEKLKAQTNPEVKGVHAVNLVEMYAKDKGVANLTVSGFMNNEDALKFASEQISLYAGYLRKQSVLFNTEGKVKFVPKERLVCQILGAFEKRLNTLAMSNTFHKELLELPLHETVGCWQTLGNLSFDEVSGIHVTNASGNNVEQSGIVALLCDKWAIMHTIKKQRVASQNFPIEDLTHYAYQFRDQYMNNLGQNAVVFFLGDYAGV